MVTLSMLWLPILLSAVAVLIAANVLWMALPFWHNADYGRVPEEKLILDAMSTAKSGQYLVPRMDWRKLTPEERQASQSRPVVYMLVRNPAKFSFAPALVLYFLYGLAIAIIVGYLTGRTRGPGAESLEVFRVAGTAGFLAYGFRSVSDAIWYGKPWRVAFKEMIDGLIYGLLMGAIFSWLWPR
jgi:hypothetical protein